MCYDVHPCHGVALCDSVNPCIMVSTHSWETIASTIADDRFKWLSTIGEPMGWWGSMVEVKMIVNVDHHLCDGQLNMNEGGSSG